MFNRIEQIEPSDIRKEMDTIEDKRRKNVLDNQKFLKSLHLLNVRDDLKSSVTSAAKVDKPSRKKIIEPSEIRRSSRIRSMPHAHYNSQPVDDEKTIVVSTDESSDEEDEEELISAFASKVDNDWEPAHPEKRVVKKQPHSTHQAVKRSAGGVKIYLPNTGLQASTITGKERPQRARVLKKLNLAISSSEDEEEEEEEEED
ncbi:unnamed protein product [Adineta ricciae]|uniref:Uncharacterized protein n=1 Tax=Adineta ricciae TaxID=249248 RepID=A0A814B534_ADIRI|nr:unnamed protein product [Adineta ricciae]CAF0921973.1 unnamed protein product [Adineta ricciae]